MSTNNETSFRHEMISHSTAKFCTSNASCIKDGFPGSTVSIENLIVQADFVALKCVDQKVKWLFPGFNYVLKMGASCRLSVAQPQLRRQT